MVISKGGQELTFGDQELRASSCLFKSSRSSKDGAADSVGGGCCDSSAFGSSRTRPSGRASVKKNKSKWILNGRKIYFRAAEQTEMLNFYHN